MVIITNVNGTAIRDSEAFHEAVAGLSIGEPVSVVGYDSSTESDGQLKWIPKSWDIKPERLRDVILDSLVRNRNAANKSTTFRHNLSPVKPTDGDSVYLYIVKFDGAKPQLRYRFQLRPRGDKTLDIQFKYHRTTGIGLLATNYEKAIFASSPEFIHGHYPSVWIDDGVDDRARHGFAHWIESESPVVAQMLHTESSQREEDSDFARKRPITLPEAHALKTVLQAYAIMQRESK